MSPCQNSTAALKGMGCKPQMVLVGMVLTVLIVVTICGNVVVCLAVSFNRKLRSLTNCFIVSLAITDLLLGLLVLPFSAIYELTREWHFGPTLCNIYTSLDVMLCTASILNLFMISIDRYYAITAPLRYTQLVTPLRVAVAMFVIWVVSLMVSFLPIHLGWNTNGTGVQNMGVNDSLVCKLAVNAEYGLVDALLTFYLPLVVMCIMYYRIFRIAREQAKRISHATCCKVASPALLTVKEHKATVTLAAVLGAFIICWFPYFTVFTYRGMKGDKVDDMSQSIVLWLGYANSALNPILYAALNRDFRTAYQRLFHCRRVGPLSRSTPLTPTHLPHARARARKQARCMQEEKPLRMQVRNGKNSLTREAAERSPAPSGSSSSTILSCWRGLWLAKFLPKGGMWIPACEEPATELQKRVKPPGPPRVIYCVFS
ncbi:histamine H2 receptor isoform X1 [Gopherus flavomarginatus]|uniref:histamine H2 receptor isoform X1 n=1 Tax=Gopherus flavomarginatus TaxID=286002 RepID=UPI0021CC0FC8|nr:histamine H2 receptor isoform X1 [Gopherus flavomarginatus]XP_050817752.1 histamine H2 receptor isoform X1 [Gopherus flavomarginatus]XP_050817753.1 histamine H2 receptor isoform X1 [Gopherus flavomarginatus]XP_050817754.1 histamine H2 receptor isoform X1 [Gopherus flavomarginatus]XP_050817755.1 histamine H2 receptor isoform X1 [Gopherus flavomarginatus]XP_050817757.1 histamine H2 receptor isoform X1 [Gopherus flavomarginatus]XP_050817758.1 histamine H2 receptor isoform X1 [Gopherus flavoma